MIPIRREDEIGKLRKSADLLVKTFHAVKRSIEPGVDTATLDKIAEETILGGGGKPAFKGYRGFPATICASFNEQVVHGIPGSRKCQEGEILSVDIGVELDGYFSDASRTYTLGRIPKETQRLLDATKTALYRGIRKCRSGKYLGDISHAIQSHVESRGFSVVRDLVGHGIGEKLHEEPQIPNFGQPRRGPKLEVGMVFAIEPMINMGGPEVKFLDDGWTVVTADGLPSAHFEHTVLITSSKPEILTIGIEDDNIRRDHG